MLSIGGINERGSTGYEGGLAGRFELGEGSGHDIDVFDRDGADRQCGTQRGYRCRGRRPFQRFRGDSLAGTRRCTEVTFGEHRDPLQMLCHDQRTSVKPCPHVPDGFERGDGGTQRCDRRIEPVDHSNVFEYARQRHGASVPENEQMFYRANDLGGATSGLGTPRRCTNWPMPMNWAMV